MATEQVTLGGGCFWCLEPIFTALRGVHSSVSGYAGGTAENPTYEQVCGKRTGHAEVVQLTFDPAEIELADILRVFFTMHDPTTPNQQGADVGPQYRSIILTTSDAQAEVARAVKAEIESSGVWGRPLVTEIVPLTTFWRAEDEHQDYFERKPVVWLLPCRHHAEGREAAQDVQRPAKGGAGRLSRCLRMPGAHFRTPTGGWVRPG